MELIEKKEDKITFIAEIDESLTNAIRRYVDQIPILAIDEVEISKNDSPLYDETIAHRLGLIPLKNENIKEGEEKKLTLNSKKEGYVYSEELKGEVSPVYNKIPITLLNKGQELEVLAIARVGKGSEHVRFSPGLLYYRNLNKIKIDKNCPKEIINICPLNVFKEKDGEIIADEKKCDDCGWCVEFCKKQGKNWINISSTEKLIITVESFGQISEKEIFKKSIESLKKDLKEFLKKIKG
jgi:DNA-directed RNA polymerase subunit D